MEGGAVAIREVFDEDGLTAGIRTADLIPPRWDGGGETMIFCANGWGLLEPMEHARPFSDRAQLLARPDLMYPFLEELSEKANVAISCYPNAGLPNPLSPTGFDLGPSDMARYLSEFARGG